MSGYKFGIYLNLGHARDAILQLSFFHFTLSYCKLQRDAQQTHANLFIRAILRAYCYNHDQRALSGIKCTVSPKVPL